MRDSTHGTGMLTGLVERNDVFGARCLDVNASFIAPDLIGPEHFVVETERTFGVAHGEDDVSQAIRTNHGDYCRSAALDRRPKASAPATRQRAKACRSWKKDVTAPR